MPKFDIYSQSTNYENKIKERLCVGGYETFEDAVNACYGLNGIAVGRLSTDKPRIFRVKECGHVEMDWRKRNSLKDDHTDRKHHPIEPTNINSLINAYFDM